MSKAGGSSTIAGVNFEAWFVALKFVDAFFDETLEVTPQATTFIDPQTYQREIVSIDDIYIRSPDKQEFYNLKSNAPDGVRWRLSELKQQNVLAQMESQYQKTPDAKLYFVSQSPCVLFKEVFERTRTCSSRKELEITLASNN